MNDSDAKIKECLIAAVHILDDEFGEDYAKRNPAILLRLVEILVNNRGEK